MKNEDESDLGVNINDVNSDILSNKGINLTKKTKLILGITILSILISTLIIIIIIVITKKDKNEDNDEDDKLNPELVAAEVLCKYNI